MTDEDKTPAEEPLPEGVPEPPDIEKVRALRRKMRAERQRGGGRPFRVGTEKRGIDLDEKTGKRARDIGIYTVIPMMLLAGPAIGFLMGMFIENRWGGAPWPTVIGALFGLAAAFRQIFLMLAQKSAEEAKDKRF
jgi:F0F1-type ATP synthase assembly protein I